MREDGVMHLSSLGGCCFAAWVSAWWLSAWLGLVILVCVSIRCLASESNAVSVHDGSNGSRRADCVVRHSFQPKKIGSVEQWRTGRRVSVSRHGIWQFTAMQDTYRVDFLDESLVLQWLRLLITRRRRVQWAQVESTVVMIGGVTQICSGKARQWLANQDDHSEW